MSADRHETGLKARRRVLGNGHVDWAEAATLLHKSGARWPDAFRRAGLKVR